MFGAEKIVDHSNKLSEIKIGRNWIYLIKYVTPIILGAILFVKITELKDGYGDYPGWALCIGAGTILLSVLISMFISWRYKECGD